MPSLSIYRKALASSSRTCRSTPILQIRLLSITSPRSDLLSENDNKVNPRDVIEQKRKQFEEKYSEKLKQKMEAEGVRDLDSLKHKVMVPSVKAALKAKRAAKEYTVQKEAQVKASQEVLSRNAFPSSSSSTKAQDSQEAQAKGDRAGIKPLSSILNLPLLHMTPHDREAVAKIWTAYHSAHPTLSSSYLSAHLPTETYNSMLNLARTNPFFVVPLPRSTSAEDDAGSVLTDQYEMFYLQWLFHPTSFTSIPPSPEANPSPLPLTSSVIFTPLEAFKKAGEWAQPYLVLTHYPEMAHSHDLVLMRGEISSTSAGGPTGSEANPGSLLSQQQAQLLALALQRFYCTGLEMPGESEHGKQDRLKRAEALSGFRERPEEWDWNGLVEMAYAGVV